MREKRGKRKNKLIFGACTVIYSAAAMLWINALPVMATEDAGEEMVVGENADAGISAGAAGELSENSRGGVSKSVNTTMDKDVGVYDFKDNKTDGTVTVTKIWNDYKTNEKRVIPDIKISTSKPSKSALGYTVTFHGNQDAGLVFDDGSDVNNVVYNSSGQIVDGKFKIPKGTGVGWYTDTDYTNKIDLTYDGIFTQTLNSDIDLWAKELTFKIKGFNNDSSKKYNDFNYLIPDDVTEVIFTYERKPEFASAIDVDDDGDGGVVAWTENNGTVMKVSTQIKGLNVQAAGNSAFMFYYRPKLTNIDLSALDTSLVTNMNCMFQTCSGLTGLNLKSLNTSNVTNMSGMFANCSGFTTLNLSSLDTYNVTDMSYMFSNCNKLVSLNLSSVDTSNVTAMGSMFEYCNSLVTLNLSSFDTQKCNGMAFMFRNCDNLTNLDLSEFTISEETSVYNMFIDCDNLKTIKFGANFVKFGYGSCLYGTWRNTSGETFTSGSFPSNVADTYTKISN